MIGATQPRRRLDQCIGYFLQVEVRAANDFERICGDRLQLQRLAEPVLMHEVSELKRRRIVDC
jgi:hypothetical protein